MNVLEQICLNSSVLLYGVLLLLPALSRLNTFLYMGLAWLTGWGVVGFMNILIVMSGVMSTLPKMAFCCLLILFVIAICLLRPYQLAHMNLKRFLAILVGYGIIVSILILLTKYANYVYYSTDSITNEGLSRTFHLFTAFDGGYNRLYTWLFNLRLPFYVSVNNIAYLSGIKVFYSFLSVTTIMVTVLLTGAWLNKINKINIYSVLWLFVCAGLFFTEKHIILHSLYLLSNLTTMAYFSAGVVCLDLYRQNKQTALFILGSFFLGLTCLIRKEMLVFSLIPYWFVFKDLRPNTQLIFQAFLLYVFSAYSWFFWGLFFVQSSNFTVILKKAFKTTGHGSVGIVPFCFFLSIVTFFAVTKIINKKNFLLTYLVSLSIITILLCSFLGSVNESASNLMLLMYKGAGKWGTFWYFLLFLLFISAISHFFLEYSHQKRFFMPDSFLPLIIISFLFVRIYLYAFFSGPKDFASGNRMLIHIFPLCVYWIGKMGIKQDQSNLILSA